MFTSSINCYLNSGGISVSKYLHLQIRINFYQYSAAGDYCSVSQTLYLKNFIEAPTNIHWIKIVTNIDNYGTIVVNGNYIYNHSYNAWVGSGFPQLHVNQSFSYNFDNNSYVYIRGDDDGGGQAEISGYIDIYLK